MLNRSKFLNAPLNNGMTPVRITFNGPCYCIVGAYIHACGANDEDVDATYHNEYAFRHLDDVPDEVITVLAQSELKLMELTGKKRDLSFGVHIPLDDREAMTFKLEVLERLIAAGVKLEEESPSTVPDACLVTA